MVRKPGVIYVGVKLRDGLVHLGRFANIPNWPEECAAKQLSLTVVCEFNARYITYRGHPDKHVLHREYSLAKGEVTCIQCVSMRADIARQELQ
jgi:hypothetical protein